MLWSFLLASYWNCLDINLVMSALVIGWLHFAFSCTNISSALGFIISSIWRGFCCLNVNTTNWNQFILSRFILYQQEFYSNNCVQRLCIWSVGNSLGGFISYLVWYILFSFMSREVREHCRFPSHANKGSVNQLGSIIPSTSCTMLDFILWACKIQLALVVKQEK